MNMPDIIKIIVDTAGLEGHGAFIYLENQKPVLVGRHTGTGQTDLPLYNQLVIQAALPLKAVFITMYMSRISAVKMAPS